MKSSVSPMFATVRQELEERWRLRLERAQGRYQAATAQYRRMLNEQPEGLTPIADSPVSQAREAESQALAQYARVLTMERCRTNK
jgi:hypothetical protein